MSRYEHELVSLKDYRSSYASLSNDRTKDVAIVFVHGFGGNSIATWALFQILGNLLEDPIQHWHRCDLYFYGYDSTNWKTAVSSHADAVRKFIQSIFPKPQLSGFAALSVELMNQMEDTFGSDFPYGILSERINPPEYYSRLILVGHSLGGVVLRQVLLNRALDYVNGYGTDQPEHIPAKFELLFADVCLFAPAIFGTSFVGFKGLVLNLCTAIPGMREALKSWPVWAELQPNSARVQRLKSETERVASICPWMQALRARLIFGYDENVVEIDRYACDREVKYIPECDHVTICKPSERNLQPIEFVIDGLKERTASS